MKVFNMNDNFANELVLSVKQIDDFASEMVQEIEKADVFAQTQSKPSYALTVEPQTETDKKTNVNAKQIQASSTSTETIQPEIVSKNSKTQLSVKTDSAERKRKVHWLEVLLIAGGIGIIAWALLKKEAKEQPKEQQPKQNQT
ncbi:hypothetical protein [Raineya orbicola]|uniref:Uncharacterized protein n=1 Tax=Raineya orbicola TaxID=2016530 RepID=A0A2N3I866_9BACT|nr:hypothetical protein [Raineya orbicola]PKQ66443.1 hypothetical protein Rain11_2394 [Raineya orbicola]